MSHLLARLGRAFKLGAIVGAVIAVLRALRGRGRADATGEARWQPLSDTEPATVEHRDDQVWVEPVDGACPASHPVKTNASSGIFHLPGGAFYVRTKPERCYTSAAAAEAAGFRRAKR